MELTTWQKQDRIRQSLYLFCQENKGLCRPIENKYVVVYKEWFYVCDLVNKGVELFDKIEQYLNIKFVDYSIGFENNNRAAQYVLDKFAN
jgi:hypothetical protein